MPYSALDGALDATKGRQEGQQRGHRYVPVANAGSGSMVAGAVRASTVTATHMAAKANEPTASSATWG